MPERDAEPARQRVVISAIACLPGGGSEAGVGWEWTRAAALRHEVWLLTSNEHRDAIEQAKRDEGLVGLHPVYVDAGASERWRGRRPLGRYVHYVLWQRAAARVARELCRQVRPSLVHHVTFATDFLPIGIAAVRGVPLVVGPLGGTAPLPLRLWRWMGWRGALRRAITAPSIELVRRAFVDRSVRRAQVALSLNRETAQRLGRLGPLVLVEPNASVNPCDVANGSGARQERLAVFAGRVVGWKGLRLAIAALEQPVAAGWQLEVLGDGPDMAAIRRRAERSPAGQRIRFYGWAQPDEVAAALRRAHCLLFPSLLDAAPWIVAEAVAAGTPVVAFDWLGTAVMAADRPQGLVALGRDPARRLADALEACPLGVPLSDRSSRERLTGLLTEVYALACADTSDCSARATGITAPRSPGRVG